MLGGSRLRTVFRFLALVWMLGLCGGFPSGGAPPLAVGRGPRSESCSGRGHCPVAQDRRSLTDTWKFWRSDTKLYGEPELSLHSHDP